jgi:formate dehydrogenase gamma subunit
MKDTYRRFSAARIIEHLVQIVTVCVLVATGLSQKFYSSDVSVWLILKLGGIDNTRIIHRYTALIFSLLVIVHIIAGTIGIVVRKWQPSMIITKNDFKNAVHNIKYYLGIENFPSMSGKYNYTQKFEYWGILTGGLMMVGTGAVLWQPVFFSRFMAGELIPLAKVLHSEEALVVFLIIAGWHIYNAIFSPEVFPLNVSIFTGHITKDRMISQHLHELAAIEGRTPEEIREQVQKDAIRERKAESEEARRRSRNSN